MLKALILPAVLATSGCGLLSGLLPEHDIEIDLDVVEDDVTEIQPLIFDIVLDDTSPSTTPTLVGAEEWGRLMRAAVLADDGGRGRLFSPRNEQDPTFTGAAPVVFTIDVSSADGEVWGDTLAGSTDRPLSCTVTLDPQTAEPDDLPNALADCLVDWTRANGTPSALSITISGTPTVSAVGGGTAFSYSNLNVGLYTDDLIEFGCSGGLVVDNAVVDNIGDIQIENMRLRATGGSVSGEVLICWSAMVFDSEGIRQTLADGVGLFNDGETRNYDITVANAGGDAVVEADNPADVRFVTPTEPGAWLEDAIGGLSGQDTGEKGAGRACWWHIGATPRDGLFTVSILADAGL